MSEVTRRISDEELTEMIADAYRQGFLDSVSVLQAVVPNSKKMAAAMLARFKGENDE